MSDEIAWFAACAQNNQLFVQQNIKYFVKQVDQRGDFLPDSYILSNFSGLLYAVFYNCVDVVQLLLEHEYEITVQENIKILATGISSTMKYSASPRTHCLMLAVMRGSEACIKFIQQQCLSNNILRSSLYGSLSSSGMSTLCLCVLGSNNVANFELLRDDQFLSAELLVGDDKNLFSFSCQYGQIKVIQYVHKLFKDQKSSNQLKYQLALLLLQRDSSESGTYIELCLEDVKFLERTNSNMVTKEKCAIYMCEILQMALNFVVLSDKQEFHKLLKKWMSFKYQYTDFNDESQTVQLMGKDELLRLQSKQQSQFDMSDFFKQSVQKASQHFIRISRAKEQMLVNWFKGDLKFVSNQIILRECVRCHHPTYNYYLIMQAICTDNVELFKFLFKFEKLMICSQDCTVSKIQLKKGDDIFDSVIRSNAIKISEILSSLDIKVVLQSSLLNKLLDLATFNEAAVALSKIPALIDQASEHNLPKILSKSPQIFKNLVDSFNSLKLKAQLYQIIIISFNRNFITQLSKEQFGVDLFRDFIQHCYVHDWIQNIKYKQQLLKFCSEEQIDYLQSKYDSLHIQLIRQLLNKDGSLKGGKQQNFIQIGASCLQNETYSTLHYICSLQQDQLLTNFLTSLQNFDQINMIRSCYIQLLSLFDGQLCNQCVSDAKLSQNIQELQHSAVMFLSNDVTTRIYALKAVTLVGFEQINLFNEDKEQLLMNKFMIKASLVKPAPYQLTIPSIQTTYLQLKQKKFFSFMEVRNSDFVNQIYQNFSALEYAIVFQSQDVFNYQNQFGNKLLNSVLLKYKSDYVFVPQGASVLQLSIFAQNIEAAKSILKVQKDLQLVEDLNAFGLNALNCAVKLQDREFVVLLIGFYGKFGEKTLLPCIENYKFQQLLEMSVFPFDTFQNSAAIQSCLIAKLAAFCQQLDQLQQMKKVAHKSVIFEVEQFLKTANEAPSVKLIAGLDLIKLRYKVSTDQYSKVRNFGNQEQGVSKLFDELKTARAADPKLQSAYEQRVFDEVNQIFTGFGAVHYAITFNNLQLFKSCTSQYGALTQDSIVVENTFIPKGISAIQLAFLLNRPEIQKLLLQNLTKVEDLISGNPTPITYASLNNQSAQLLFQSQFFMTLVRNNDCSVFRGITNSVFRSYNGFACQDFAKIAASLIDADLLDKIFDYQDLVSESNQQIAFQKLLLAEVIQSCFKRKIFKDQILNYMKRQPKVRSDKDVTNDVKERWESFGAKVAK